MNNPTPRDQPRISPDPALKCDCGYCGTKLEGDDLGSPLRDADGDRICERCYTEHYEGFCDRCGETAAKKELAMLPGELVALWEEVESLKPGYYRVVKWPIYADGMIAGHIYHDALEFYAPLDDTGKRASKDAWTLGGCLCKECRDEISKLNAA